MTYIEHLDPEFLAAAEAAAENAPAEPEDEERFVPEADFHAATEQDHRDLAVIRDWEDFGGFHNP